MIKLIDQTINLDIKYYPKKVKTYEANAILDTVIDFITGKDVSARILGKDIYIVKPDTDNNKISFKKYKMSTVKANIDGKTISKKAVKEDKDFDEIEDEDMDDFSIDAHGNLWVLSKGRIKKYVNGELSTLYKLNAPITAIDNSVAEKTVPSENTSAEPQSVAQTGWVKNEDGSWSYKNLDGTNATGWINNNGNWYYLNNDGKMQTGWINDGTDWYYLNPSGEMKTGWHKDSNGKWYYLLESGKMAHDTVVNGYTIDSNGAWV